MADIKNVITQGIGASPGSVKFFITMGLDIGAAAAPSATTWTLYDRDTTWTLPDYDST